MGKCTFNNYWLGKDDSQGHKVKEWGKKHSNHELYCMACEKTISISKGFQSITQHASTDKHKQKLQLKWNPNQLHLKAISDPSCSSDQQDGPVPSSSLYDKTKKSLRTVELFSLRDRIATAELVWSLKCVASDFSFSSCNGLRETFQVSAKILFYFIDLFYY
jgi:hypothetical protein